MADEPRDEDVLEIDPLTGGKTPSQTPTPDEELVELPATEDQEPAGELDRTTGAAHPVARDR